MMPSTRTQTPAEQFRRYYQRLSPAWKKPHMRASTAAVFSFLAIALFAWFAIRPTAQTIIYLRREIADKTTLNEQMENKITALIEAQSNYETIEDRLPLVDQALPENPDAVLLARQLRNLANISGASIAAIQIPPLPILSNEATPGARLTTTKQLQEFPFTITITGPYAALKNVIEGLLTLRRIVAIEGISIKPAGDVLLRTDTLQSVVKLISYYGMR